MNAGAHHLLKQYQAVGAAGSVAAADPHRLVQLMLENILQRIAAARGHLQRHEVARKAEQVSKAIDVIAALNGSLNLEAGGEIAANLRLLYDYCCTRLVLANARNDESILEEVATIVRRIKEGWDGIGDRARELARTAP